MRRFEVLLVFGGALVVALGVGGSAHAAEVGYTDGTQCQGPFCPGGPPPLDPVWAKGQECKIDIIDPLSFVYVTEHFVYGTTPPPAGVVPVVADASAVFRYQGVAPGQFAVDISTLVAGKQGFRADTWNIGTGVTAWVPFDCAIAETTTSSSSTTTTSIGGETSTTSSSSTTTSIEPLGSTTTSIEPLSSTTTVAGASASSGSLPITGGGRGIIAAALVTLGAGVALVVGTKRRRTSPRR